MGTVPVETIVVFDVEGLSGLACERRVEVAAESVSGVRQARGRSDLALLGVFFGASEAEPDVGAAIAAVEATGHRIRARATSN